MVQMPPTRPFDVKEMEETRDPPTYDPIGQRLSPGRPQVGDDFVNAFRSLPPRSPNSPEAIPTPQGEAPAEDAINPAHYRKHPSGIECIEVTRHMNFNTGNAIKYIWRYLDKGDPIENLKKAQWYLDDEIRRLEGKR